MHQSHKKHFDFLEIEILPLFYSFVSSETLEILMAHLVIVRHQIPTIAESSIRLRIYQHRLYETIPNAKINLHSRFEADPFLFRSFLDIFPIFPKSDVLVRVWPRCLGEVGGFPDPFLPPSCWLSAMLDFYRQNLKFT